MLSVCVSLQLHSSVVFVHLLYHSMHRYPYSLLLVHLGEMQQRKKKWFFLKLKVCIFGVSYTVTLQQLKNTSLKCFCSWQMWRCSHARQGWDGFWGWGRGCRELLLLGWTRLCPDLLNYQCWAIFFECRCVPFTHVSFFWGFFFDTNFASDLLACISRWLVKPQIYLLKWDVSYLPVNLIFPRLIQNKGYLDVKIHVLLDRVECIFFHIKSRSCCFFFGSCTCKELLLLSFI